MGTVSQQTRNLKDVVAKQISALKQEFRALRAESRNIDFGNLHDDKQFRSASQQVHQYINALKSLEQQVEKDTAAGREFAAQLKTQQTAVRNRVDIAEQQRRSAIASERRGRAQGTAASSVAAAIPLLSIGKESIKVLTGFDDQMSQVKAVSGATNKELAQIRQKAKDLGAQTRFSASNAAAGFVLLGQAGYAVDKQLAAIDGTLNLAAAGSLELARATDITVSVLGGFQLGADKAIHAADVLALTANQANLDVSDLGESLKFAGPPAKAFGATLEQTSALLGVLSNAGIRGSEAGTALRAMFLRLAAPTGMAKTAMKGLGVSIADASGNIKPIDQILGELQSSLSTLGAADQLKAIKTIFGTEATPAVQTLLSNIKGIQDLTAANLTAAGAAQKAAKIMEDNIGGSFRNFQSAAEGVLIEIGEVLAPTVIKVTNALSGLMTKFIQLPQPIKAAIIITGALTAAALTLTAVIAAGAAAFFGLETAIATSNVAAVAMTRGLLPLTGFFETAIAAFGTQGLTGVLGMMGSQLAAVLAPLSALSIALASLYVLLELATPKISILGTVIGGLAAPFAFVYGLLKGFTVGIARAFQPFGEVIGQTLTVPFHELGEAIAQVQQIWQHFAGQGEQMGLALANALTLPLHKGMNLVLGTWQATVGKLIAFLQPLTTAARQVGGFLVSALAENSPGTTFQIRQKWEETVGFVLGKLDYLVAGAQWVGSKLQQVFGAAAQGIQSHWSGVLSILTNVGEVILHLTRTVLLSAAVQKILPKFSDGLRSSGKGSFYSSQKIGNRIAQLLSEALAFSFEQDVGTFGLSKLLTAKVLGFSELVEDLLRNKFTQPVGRFLKSFLAPWLRSALMAAIPSDLGRSISQILEQIILNPRELPQIGPKFFAPVLDFFGLIARQRFDNLVPLVKGLQAIAQQVRPVFILLEETFPVALFTRIALLGGAFARLAPVLAPLLPVLAQTSTLLGSIFWWVGAALVLVDLFKTLRVVLAEPLAAALRGLIDLGEQLIGGLKLGLQVLTRTLVTSLVQMMTDAGFAVQGAWHQAIAAISLSITSLIPLASSVATQIIGYLNHSASEQTTSAWVIARESIQAQLAALVHSARQTGTEIYNAFASLTPENLWQSFNQGAQVAFANLGQIVQQSVAQAQEALISITSFNPIEALNHSLAGLLRNFVGNLNALSAGLLFVSVAFLQPLAVELPLVLQPLVRSLPAIIAALTGLNLLDFGTDFPLHSQLNALLSQIDDTTLALINLAATAYTAFAVGPLVMQIRRGLTPALQATYRVVQSIRQGIVALGGILPYLKFQIQQLSGLLTGFYTSQLEPIIGPFVRGLRTVYALTQAVVTQFLNLPGVRQVVQSLVTSAKAFGRLITPTLQALAQWFKTTLIPTISPFITWLSLQITLLIRQIGQAAQAFAQSPLGQVVIKGGIQAGAQALATGKAVAQAGAKAGTGIVQTGAAIARKTMEAYTLGKQVGQQVQQAINALVPYLKDMSHQLELMVRNTAGTLSSFSTRPGFERRNLKYLGVPEQIRRNAITPAEFLPGIKVREIRRDKFAQGLMADPFWKAREGTDLFNEKVNALTQSFSGFRGAFNVFKTLPMLFTRPALAVSILAAQLEVVLGAMALIGVAVFVASQMYPKTFERIGHVITNWVIPALAGFIEFLVKVIPPALIGLTRLIDQMGGVLKFTFFDIPAGGVVVMLSAIDVALSALWGFTQAVKLTARLIRELLVPLLQAVVAAWRGDFRPLQAIAINLSDFLQAIAINIRTALTNGFINVLQTAQIQWTRFTDSIQRNERRIRTVAGSVLLVGGGIAALTTLLIAMANPVAGIGLLISAIASILTTGLGAAILPGKRLQDKLQAIQVTTARTVESSKHAVADLGGTVVSTAKTTGTWLLNLVKVAGIAAASLAGLYTGFVLVVGGLNPLVAGIVLLGGLLPLILTGGVEAFADQVLAVLNPIIDTVRSFRQNLISTILAPFNLDPYFQQGANFLSSIFDSLKKFLPFLLLGMTLFNGLFKTSGNWGQAFLSSVQQVGAGIFKFLIQPVFQLIKALANLSFISGRKSREAVQSFEVQTGALAATTQVRGGLLARTPLGLGAEDVEAVQAQVAERRQIMQFRQLAKADRRFMVQAEKKYLLAAARDIQDPEARADYSQREIDQLEHLVTFRPKQRLFGLLPQKQTAALTDAGQSYLKRFEKQLMEGKARPALSGDGYSGLASSRLQTLAERSGLHQPGAAEFSSDSLRSLAFGRKGLEEYLGGKIQRIYAERVEIVTSNMQVGGGTNTLAPASTMAAQSMGQRRQGFPMTPSRYSYEPIARSDVDRLYQSAKTQNNYRSLGEAKTKQTLEKAYTAQNLGALSDTDLNSLGRVLGFRPDDFAPDQIAKKSEGQFNKVRQLERTLLEAKILSATGAAPSELIGDFKSAAQLKTMMSQTSDIKQYMRALGVSEERMTEHFQRYNAATSGIKGSGSKRPAFEKHVVQPILERQIELLTQESIIRSDFALPTNIERTTLEQELLGRFTSRGELERLKPDQLRNIGKMLGTQSAMVGTFSRDPVRQKQELVQEIYETLRAYSYKLEQESTGKRIGPQAIEAIRITGSLPVLKTQGSMSGVAQVSASMQARYDAIQSEIQEVQKAITAAETEYNRIQNQLANLSQMRAAEQRDIDVVAIELQGLLQDQQNIMINKRGEMAMLRRQADQTSAQLPLPEGLNPELIRNRLNLIAQLGQQKSPSSNVRVADTGQDLAGFFPVLRALNVAGLRSDAEIESSPYVGSLKRGRLEEVDPLIVKQLASYLGVTSTELYAGRQFNSQERLALSQSRVSVLESLGAESAKRRGLRGVEARQAGSIQGIAQQAGLKQSELQGILTGEGDYRAIKAVADALEMSQTELESQLTGTVSVFAKRQQLGWKERMQKFLQSPTSFLPGPAQGALYKGAMQTKLQAVAAEEQRQAQFRQQRLTAFSAITDKVELSTGAKGNAAIAQLLGQMGGGLNLRDIEDFLSTGKFVAADQFSADQKMASFKQLGDRLTAGFKAQGLQAQIDLTQLESFDVADLNPPTEAASGVIGRIKQMFQRTTATLQRSRQQVDQSAATAQTQTQRQVQQQASLLNSLANKPVLGRLVQLYRDYKVKEQNSLQYLLRQNQMSLDQLQVYLVDIMGVPFEEFAKFLRGQKVGTDSLKKMQTLFANSPQLRAYESQIEAIRQQEAEQVKTLNTDQVKALREANQKRIAQIEEQFLRGFFDSKQFSVGPLPSLGGYILKRLVKEDAPKLARQAITLIWGSISAASIHTVTAIAPSILSSSFTLGVRIAGAALKTLGDPIYRRYFPNLFRQLSSTTNQVVGGAALRLTAIRRLFPESQLLKQLQERLLQFSDSLANYFVRQAETAEAARDAVNSGQKQGFWRASFIALQRVGSSLVDFVTTLPTQFEQAKAQAFSRVRSLFSIARGIFDKIVSGVKTFFTFVEEGFQGRYRRTPTFGLRETGRYTGTGAPPTSGGMLQDAHGRFVSRRRGVVERQADESSDRNRLLMAQSGTLRPASGSIKIPVLLRSLVQGAQRLSSNPPVNSVTPELNSRELIKQRRLVRLRDRRIGERFAAFGGYLESAATKVRNLGVTKAGALFGRAGAPKVETTFVRKARRYDPATYEASLQRRPPAEGKLLDTSTNLETGRTYERMLTFSFGQQIYRSLAKATRSTTERMANYFVAAAQRSRTAWQESGQQIAGRTWLNLAQRALITGLKITGFLSERSPGPSYQVRQNWAHTADSVEQNMYEMAATAQVAGHQIENSVGKPGFFRRVIGSFGKIGQAGMAVGGAIGTAGMAAQTITFSLGNLGIISEKNAAQLNKLFEVFTVLGTVGGLVSPILGAVFSVLGAGASIISTVISGAIALVPAIIGVGGAVFTFLISPIGLAVAAVLGGLALIHLGLKQFFSIDLLAPVVSWFAQLSRAVTSHVEQTFQSAIARIEQAWQGMVARFWPLLQPIVQPAIDIAQQLVRTLNCSPTETIPLAWEGAVARIKDALLNLPIVGDLVSGKLTQIFAPEGILGGISKALKTVMPATSATQPVSKAVKAMPLATSKAAGWWGHVSGMFKPKPLTSAATVEQSLEPVLLDMTQALQRAYDQAQAAGASPETLKAIRAIQQSSFSGPTGQNLLAAEQLAALESGKSGAEAAKYVQAGLTTQNLMSHAAGVGEGLPIAAQVQTQLQAAQQQMGIAMTNLGDEWGDRWSLLERTGGMEVGALFAPGMDQVQSQLHVLGGDFIDFGKRAGTALLHLDFNALGEATKDFGGNFLYASKQILDGFGSMSLSAIAFGVWSLTSLSPVVLVLGGIALATVGIATNFLGLRNILFGGLKLIVGLLQAVTSLIRGMVQILSGLSTMVSGLFAALRGDFSQLYEGARLVLTGIQTIANGVSQGLRTALGGALQMLKGLFQGLGQIAKFILNAIGFSAASVRSQFQRINNGVRILGNALIMAIAKPQQAWQGFLNLLEQIRAKVQGVTNAVSGSAAGRMVQAVKLRATGKASSMNAAREMVDFDQRLKGNEPGLSVGDHAVLAQQKVGGFFGRLFNRTAAPATPVSDVARQPVQTSTQNGIRPFLRPQTKPTGANVRETISSTSDVLFTLSGALSVFAPTIAAPLLAVSSLVDGLMGLGEVSKALPGLLQTLKPIFIGMWASIQSMLAGLMTALAPVLPFILAVAAAAALLYFAFKTNFLGINNLVQGITDSFKLLWNLLVEGVGQSISGVFTALHVELSSLWGQLKQLGAIFLQPFLPLLQLFGGGSGSLAGAIRLSVNIMLLPLRLLAQTLVSSIKLISFIAQGIIKIAQIAATVMLAPFRLQQAILQGIQFVLGNIWQGIVAIAQTAVNILLSPFQLIGSLVQGLGSLVTSAVQTLWNLIPAPIRWLAEQAIAGAGMMLNAGSNQPPTPVQRFASGGLVQGPGTSTGDRVPALMSPGEYVINAQATRQNYGFLDAINSGLDVESALQLMPIAPPPLVTAVTPPVVTSSGPELPPIQINLSFGDIVLGKATGAEAANEFLDAIEPQLQRRVRELLRDLIEKSR
nr:phage tail tape measure protein [Trichocoleus sp. FACHB-46]